MTMLTKKSVVICFNNKLKITQSCIVYTDGGARLTYTTMILGKNT